MTTPKSKFRKFLGMTPIQMAVVALVLGASSASHAQTPAAAAEATASNCT